MRFLVLACIAACGGTIAGPIGDGGGGGGNTDGTTGGGPDGSASDCTALLTQINAAQAKLQTCCPTCKSLQCQGTAKGICCVITINSGDKNEFETLVAKYEQQCPHACPNTPCPAAPSMMCDPSGSDPSTGHCR